jgi:hypothetical protein
MVKEKAIDLIQKVLAKANNNPNENEAELAMLKAQELMVKYNLTMSDVTTVEEEEKEVVNAQATDNGRTMWWIKSLSAVIARNFRCESINHYVGGKSHLRFIGLKDDVDIAQKIFAFAKEMVEILSNDYVDKLVREYNSNWMTNKGVKTKKDYAGAKNDYIKGFIKGLQAKFQEQIDKNGWGLIIVKDDMVVEYIDNMNLHKAPPTRVTGSGDDTHYSKGYTDGKSFEYSGNRIK